MSETVKILKRYDLVAMYSTLKIPRPLYLGDRSKRICRLCGKNRPEATFKKKAHVIPEGIGNKKIFSLYECDNCNSLYGNTIENDFNNLLSPYKLFLKISGKKGINTLKPYKGMDRIEYDQNINTVLAKLSKDNFQIDDKNNTAIIKIKTQPFNLLGIYKCLLKIALLLLPENELTIFAPSIKLLKDEIITSDPLFLKMSNTYPLGIEHIETYLYRRKSNISINPYAIFVLTFRTLIFQINLHINRLDHNVKRKPIFFDSDFRTGLQGEDQIINCNNNLNTRITFMFNIKYKASNKLTEELKNRIRAN